MKTLLVMGFLALASTSLVQASVVSSYDAASSCTLYRVIQEDSKPQQANETTHLLREVYGIALEDMEVDFDNHEVKVKGILSIVLGINQPLRKSKLIISEGIPNFNMLINQLNRKINLLERICITSDNHIAYGRVFPTSK